MTNAYVPVSGVVVRDASAVPPPVAPPVEGEAPPGTETETVEAGTEEVVPPEPGKLEQAQKAAQRARKAASKNRELVAQQQQINYRNQQLTQEAANLRAANEQARQFQERLSKDPIAAFRQLGMTDAQIQDRLIKDGSPEARIDSIMQQLEAEKNARLQLEEGIRREKANIFRQQEENNFMQASQDEKVYPNLANASPQIVLATAKQLLAELQAEGKDVSGIPNDTILSFLDHSWNGVGKRKDTSVSKSETQKSDAETSSTEKSKAGTSRTLTNRLSASVFTKPSNWDELPDREQRRLMAEMVQKSMLQKK